MQSIFLDILKGKPAHRPPVWFMRQAGRVLPNYNKLKESYSFRELMHDP
ncbi:MAG: uroporphyrinogen decarboxylase family protein, partial [Mangrovibacterium sp.]